MQDLSSTSAPPAPALSSVDWRKVLPVHPVADEYPLLSEKALRELAGDIQRNGLRLKIAVWSPDGDELARRPPPPRRPRAHRRT
jgi:hypothetical protein